MEQSRLNGKNSEAMEVEAALRKAAPPQIVLRCQFCSTNITPSSHAPKGAAGGRAGAGPVGIKVGRARLVGFAELPDVEASLHRQHYARAAARVYLRALSALAKRLCTRSLLAWVRRFLVER